MEVLIEIILALIEPFAAVIIEIIVELCFEVFGFAISTDKRANSVVAFFQYLFLGLVLGKLSLFIFPHSFARSENFHGISLVISPVLGGLAMSAMRALRNRRGEDLLRLNGFIYGATFTFGMALIRFLFTK